jgi:phosphonoacetaldehyde hydrolase
MLSYRFQRHYCGPVQAVIFDWAGTTVDFGSRAPAAVFIEVFRRRGVEISVQEAREPMGMHKKDHIRCISRMPAVAARWRTARGDEPGEADVQAMYDDFVPLQLDCITRHADLIPGCLDVVAALRSRGIKIGSNTGYDRDTMDRLTAAARQQGYEPASVVCATDVPIGRPAPWMCLENARQLGVYPMESIVKVDDTAPGIEEGLNAGMWTIGVARTGNEMGLSVDEIAALPAEDYQRRLAAGYRRLSAAGAHYVVDSVADMLPCLDDIQRQLAAGQRP